VDFLYEVLTRHVKGYKMDSRVLIRDIGTNKMVQIKMTNPYLEAWIQSVVRSPP